MVVFQGILEGGSGRSAVWKNRIFIRKWDGSHQTSNIYTPAKSQITTTAFVQGPLRYILGTSDVTLTSYV